MTVDDITSDLLPSVNVAQVASALEVMQTVDASTLPMVAQALRQLGTAITKIQTVLKQLESPAWLPQLRLGYPEDNPPFYVDEKGYLRIQGNADFDGTVSASSFQLRQLNVLDLVLTDNSPGAGSIAWSTCRVVYDGTIQVVGSGDTANKFVYWEIGDGTFTEADSFTPAVGRFLIATNDGGTADEAWNKLGASSIQRSNLMFPLLEGFQPAAYQSGQVDASLAASNNVITNATGEAGILLAFSVHLITNLTSNGDCSLEITIDGATKYSIPVIATNAFDIFTKTMQSAGTGAGATSGDWFSVQIPISYTTSMKIELVWVRSAPGAGTIQANVWRAVKV